MYRCFVINCSNPPTLLPFSTTPLACSCKASRRLSICSIQRWLLFQPCSSSDVAAKTLSRSPCGSAVSELHSSLNPWRSSATHKQAPKAWQSSRTWKPPAWGTTFPPRTLPPPTRAIRPLKGSMKDSPRSSPPTGSTAPEQRHSSIRLFEHAETLFQLSDRNGPVWGSRLMPLMSTRSPVRGSSMGEPIWIGCLRREMGHVCTPPKG